MPFTDSRPDKGETFVSNNDSNTYFKNEQYNVGSLEMVVRSLNKKWAAPEMTRFFYVVCVAMVKSDQSVPAWAWPAFI